MARKKDTELERLEQEVRELKKLNRQLMKQLKKASKGRKDRVKEVDDEQEEFVEEPQERETCPVCYERSISELKLKLVNGKEKIIKTCQSCGHRIGKT
jgi:DNA-directed RNA polymerase subunit M/transcription elongation factor TFIIS